MKTRAAASTRSPTLTVRAPDKFCLPLNHLGVLQPPHPLENPVARLVHELVLARLDTRHVDQDLACGKIRISAPRLATWTARALATMRFGRDAAHVDTGAAKMGALDHRRAQARLGAARGQRRSRLPGADDDGIERFGLHKLLQSPLAQDGVER